MRERDLDLYLTRLFIPLDERIIALADESVENLAWLRAAFGDVEFVSVAKDELTAEIMRRFAGRLSDDAIFALDRRTPKLSARTVVTRGQVCGFLLAALAGLAMTGFAPSMLAAGLVWLMSGLFLLSVFLRAQLALIGASPHETMTQDEACDDGDLPAYTILVPLYREANVVPGLVHALSALDYPSERLDIKLIVEADDAETVLACEAIAVGAFSLVRVPPSAPRTKPKAVNFALRFARGEYAVIFDAEDRPEPDQLRKAVAAFRRLPRRTACLQARLAFYNAQENWLTRLFDYDYRLWFAMLLPGLDRLRVPIPLGGTSNHFRTAVLRDIGAWDPFNVTEDADLGIRLSQHGYRVAMLDSTTFEEAPIRFTTWIKQRSRWLKGYMQTWLVHGRNTRSLVANTGLRGFLAFQLFIGGAVLSAIVNPILWGVCLVSYALPGGDHALGFVSAAGAIGSNAMLTVLFAAASIRRGDGPFALYALTVTLYWLLISIAGYRALWHLIVKPFHWEKTAHGVSSHA